MATIESNCRNCNLPLTWGDHSRCRFLYGWRFWLVMAIGVLNILMVLFVVAALIWIAVR